MLRIVVIILVMVLIVSSATGENFTLTDDGLMALDWISGNSTAILLEKTNVPGIGVRFVIEFQGNEPQDEAFRYVSHEDYGAGLLTDIDVSIYDYYELKFTLLSINSDPPADPGAVLGVGALIGPYDDHYSAYDPEGLDFDPSPDYGTTAISSTPVRLDNTASLLGFVTYLPSLYQWSPLGTTVALLIEAVPGTVAIPDLPNIYYVDANAPAGGDGRNWMKAFGRLQDALAVAEAGDEIRVAQGVYKPAVYIPPPPLPQGVDINKQDVAVTTTSREATFQLISGVAIKGGYAGFGEPDPNARDIELYETILSGDIAGNDIVVNEPCDLPDEPTRSENSYHVVTGSGTDANAILEGFTITGGNADGAYPFYDSGGGIYNDVGSPKVTNCTFNSNSARSTGGGICNWNASCPMLTNCTFSKNSAWRGGGICNWNTSSPMLTNCIFSVNLAQEHGGGMQNFMNSCPTLNNCSFSGNTTTLGCGGGIQNHESNPTLINCKFTRNSIKQGGGGIHNYMCSPLLINCAFIDNSAQHGGGVYNANGEPVLTNCIFSGNFVSQYGGGICGGNSSPTLTNCILWGDIPDEIYVFSCTPTVNYSDVQGGYVGLGNIDADPCFVDAGGGDFRLSWDSPCIDVGDNNAPNLGATDMDVHPRIIDGDCNDTDVVDMGAYEFNYAHIGDFDYNCSVDFFDFSILARVWMTQEGAPDRDWACDISEPPDDYIDWRDVVILCDNWLVEIP